jgi:mycothione reductase
VPHFDLCIIGSGSGNTIVDERFADLDVAIVEKGVFGGTCLNVGCIPTKMFVLPADLASSPAEAARLGVDLRLQGVDWPAVRDRVFGRIDPISAGGQEWRASNDNVTLYRSQVRFTGPRQLETAEGETITADRIVVAAGSRAVLPPLEGLDRVTAHTSDTVMRLERLPESMVIVGGGYIAAEFAHVFSAYGTAVTVVVRSDAMLREEDGDVSRRFTEMMSRRVDLRRNVQVSRVEPLDDDRVRVRLDDGAVLDVDVLLVATGRTPNSDLLDLGAAGIGCEEDGRIEVDEFQRTTAEGVFALGDVSSPYQLKHVANHEAKVVQHNLLHPEAMIRTSHRFVPHAVFSEPQVASVGLTEEKARELGLPYVSAVQDYGSVAYGWALEDQHHFAKLLADPATGRLLGAHVVGPQASTLLQPLIQAMAFDLDARTMATGQYWIHPALPEVVENTLLALPLE